jgi:peroxiredoxin
MATTTTTLAAELQANYDAQVKSAPAPVMATINNAKADFKASYDPKSAIQPGDKFPEFTLSDAVGKEVSSKELLAQGKGLLITFYRGEWCPYCNLALRALQRHADQFKSKGVTLVAITPELPDTALTMVEKHSLQFTVLSDVGNKLARQLGIVWNQPKEVQGLLQQFGTDWQKRNGDDSYAVPIPATILVDSAGVVRKTFVETDFMKRLEPTTALEWVDEL